MKKAFILFFSFYFLFVISPKAFASQNFSVSSDVTYTITDTKKAHAQFLIKLVNKSTKYYASSYKINVGFAHLENVAAKMGNDAISTKIHETPEGDTIELVLGTKVIGKDKVADIILTFDTPDIVQALGNSWELNIPGISKDNEFDDFNVTIKFPIVLVNLLISSPRLHSNKTATRLFFIKLIYKSLAFLSRMVINKSITLPWSII